MEETLDNEIRKHDELSVQVTKNSHERDALINERDVSEHRVGKMGKQMREVQLDLEDREKIID